LLLRSIKVFRKSVFHFMPPPSYERQRLLYFSLRPVVPMSVPCQYRRFLLCTNTERLSMIFGKGNRYQQQMNWLHFGRNCTRNNVAGYVRKFESTSNRCCHVANDFTNFTVHTARCGRTASESITHTLRGRSIIMTARCI